MSPLHRGGVSQQLSAVRGIKQLVSPQGMHILLIHHCQTHTCALTNHVCDGLDTIASANAETDATDVKRA